MNNLKNLLEMVELKEELDLLIEENIGNITINEYKILKESGILNEISVKPTNIKKIVAFLKKKKNNLSYDAKNYGTIARNYVDNLAGAPLSSRRLYNSYTSRGMNPNQAKSLAKGLTKRNVINDREKFKKLANTVKDSNVTKYGTGLGIGAVGGTFLEKKRNEKRNEDSKLRNKIKNKLRELNR